MASADILFNLFPSTFPPHNEFLFPTSALLLLDEYFFSLESHLTGEPCDYFILSLIVALNYVLACMFCIVWCQQISIWNKQIESSIYSIKQVRFFFKNRMIREGAENTENQDFKLRNMEHRDSFHRNKRMGTHWEGLNIFSYAKILCAQTMAIICI